ncbi:MAG: Eco57I restriction-modification methylase domain-containing protein [Blastocatellia bacterium]|nr:Eco57I restriction-modification methylase domain-containing protein [Blastocatellia bacterium]
MLDKLSVGPGMRVLEPCGGDGVFVDALIGKHADLQIDVYEANPQAIRTLQNKFANDERVTIFHEDTLTNRELAFYAGLGGIYDRVIANPPYGAWQDYEKRAELKKIYDLMYVKETYALFLYRCLQLIKNDGMLVFIIPDTYLNLHRHTKLRRYILSNARIVEIALFPSSFFPGVNFGYSNLSILTLQKKSRAEDCLNNSVRIVIGLGSVEDLVGPYTRQIFSVVNQRDIYNSKDHALFLSTDHNINRLINESKSYTGDIAACVTGFYSGNDRRYLRAGSSEAKNSRKYRPVDMNRVCFDPSSSENILNGIESLEHFIPILKGGNTRYYKPDIWYMDWGTEAVSNYKEDRKARFQNADYYFKKGIGVPMVSSAQITAALIENKLFDQSIVGIFPFDTQLTHYLLAFFNSPTCNKLIRTINPSANNSANYIKKIPFIRPSDDVVCRIDNLVARIVDNLKQGKTANKEIELKIYKYIKDIYGF